MENMIKKYEDLYFGRLDAEEAKILQQQIEENEDTRTSYKSFQVLMEALEEDIASDLRDKMKQWEQKQDTTKGGKVIRLGRVMSIAASVLLLVGFAIVNIIYSDSSIADRSSAEFVMSPTRDAGSSDENLYFTIYNLYESGEYDRIDEQVSIVDVDNEYYGEALMLQAKANIAMNKLEAARTAYGKALSYFDINEKQISLEVAQYEYMLFVLKVDGESEEFRKLNSDIMQDGGHLFNSHARELNRELSSFWRKFVLF